MAAPLSISLDVNYTANPYPSELKRSNLWTHKPHKKPTKSFTVFCSSSSSAATESPPKLEAEPHQSPSLSDQLKPLSSTLLSNKGNNIPAQILKTQSKSIWVNPTKPRPSALSHHRHKRTSFTHNAQTRNLNLIARLLNECDDSDEAAFVAGLGKLPQPIVWETAILVLNSLKAWKKALLFFNWIKTQNFFPMETILYNVVMKSLKNGKQFGLIEDLANEMIDGGIELNNITYCTIITCAKRCNLFDKAVEWFERMYKTGLMPDEVSYCAVLDVYGKLGKSEEEEAERLFEDMKQSENCTPDSFSFTAMINVYADGGKVDKAMELYEEMLESGVEVNVMACTCMIQCLGKAKRIDDLVEVFQVATGRGVTPDDKLCICLLFVVSLCRDENDMNKVLNTLQLANPRLASFVKLIVEDEEASVEDVKNEFKAIITDTQVDARRALCNCLIDICRNNNLQDKAHQLLYLGMHFGLYRDLHKRTAGEWILNVKTLSIGAAITALEEWIRNLTALVESEGPLPRQFSAYTGAGTHKFSRGLPGVFASHLEQLASPFRQSKDQAGCLTATREDIVAWVRSRTSSSETPVTA
ncbi:hypothetical protein Dimus_008376 [Dionaea muscipula]